MRHQGLRRLTGRQVPIDIAILISFVILIVIVTVITNSIVKPLVVQVNLLAANFNDLVSQTADLVTQLENEQTQFYIPDQVKKIINDAFVKSAITASTALPTSSSRSLPLPGPSSNFSSYRSLPFIS